MKVLYKAWVVVTIYLFTSSAWTHAGESETHSIVKLSYGANHVDFDNDKIDDLVFFARRENFNAHSFDVVSIYLQPRTDSDVHEWNIVPLFRKGKETLTLTVSGGADCLLHDFRLLKPKKSTQSLLILAVREYSASFYEENYVDFHYYTLERNTEGEMGAPFAFFNYQKTVRTKRKYCDVNQAFRSELGLENYMERN